jgi:hypothetical protein
MSRSPGAAAELDFSSGKSHLTATFRYRPSDYAALAVDNQHGLFGNLDYSRNLSSKLLLLGHLDEADFQLPSYRQNTLTASTTLNYKPGAHVAVHSGVLYSSFNGAFPSPFHLQTTSGVAGVDFLTKHFNAGGQYEPSVDSTGQMANGYSGSVATRFGHFQASATYRHAVQIPTLADLFSAIPGLQDALQRTGIFLSDPQQLQQFLTNSALLQTLGFSTNLQLNFAPVRNDTSLSADWTRNASERIGFSLIDSKTELVASNFHFRTATLSYNRKLGYNNELSLSFSAFETVQGAASTISPLVQISFRHRFNSVPAALLGGRHGMIQGHVFRDDDITRHFAGAEPESGMGGIEVRLDDNTTTRTDSEGYYVFRRVPYGIHTIQARIKDPRPYFFTTDSPASTPIDSIVDIGVSFVRGRLFGRVENDAAQGVPAVEVVITGATITRRVKTAFDGRFSAEGLPDGEFSISTAPESYPEGYNLMELPVVTTSVRADHPAPVTLVAKALRSVSGHVTTMPGGATRQLPVEGVEVTIPELKLAARTDRTGRFLFRNLPAGMYSLQAVYNGQTFTKTLDLPKEPAVLTNFDISVH